MKFKSLIGAIAVSAVALASGSALAGAIEDIKAAGVLKVGVKADYKPYGYRDPSGSIVGIEPDLAKDVADKLGVKVEYAMILNIDLWHTIIGRWEKE